MIETKRRSTILNIVLTAIILVIGFLFWPGEEKFNQSNPRDVNKTQVKITVKALNIRKEPTVESEDIGTVYLDEIFTVLEHIDNDDYYWYKIKTKQGITGYIASDRNNEYVKVINGMVDRESPVINIKNNVLVFKDGEETYEDVECVDNYSECKLEFEIIDSEFVSIKATDEAGNESDIQVRYYSVYNINTLFSENNKKMHITITKKKSNDNYIISANYINNEEILNENKSKTYTPIIEYYDEDFNMIEDMQAQINKQKLSGLCINDDNNSLSEEYLDNDIPKGSMLCMNYTFTDKEEVVKYIAIGFQGLENYDNLDNAFANYHSNYFEIE